MRPLGVLAPLVLVVATAAGCGETAEPQAVAPTTDAASGSGSGAPGIPTTPTSGTTADGLTSPGSRLVLGDPASVALKRLGEEPSGRGDLTVTSIEEVPAEEVEAAGGPTDGQVVWLVRASLEVTEVGDDFGPLQLGADLTGIVDGRAVPKLDSSPTSALDCPPGDLSGTTEAGERLDFCVSALAEEGQVVEAAWSPFETAYSLDGGTPIVWGP